MQIGEEGYGPNARLLRRYRLFRSEAGTGVHRLQPAAGAFQVREGLVLLRGEKLRMPGHQAGDFSPHGGPIAGISEIGRLLSQTAHLPGDAQGHFQSRHVREEIAYLLRITRLRREITVGTDRAERQSRLVAVSGDPGDGFAEKCAPLWPRVFSEGGEKIRRQNLLGNDRLDGRTSTRLLRRARQDPGQRQAKDSAGKGSGRHGQD